MSILADNLSRFTDIVDEWQIWMNTDADQVEDRKWLYSLPAMYDWVKIKELPPEKYNIKPKQLRTGLFYAHNTIKENTIYIRFDDDIVFIDDDFFINLLNFRIDNPKYFLVMANIFNNAMLSYIYQLIDALPRDEFEVEAPYCMDPVAWRSGPFAEYIHRRLIAAIAGGTTARYFFDHADLTGSQRFSISCFCFFGRDFDRFKGVVGQRRPGQVRFDEEIWLTEVYPTLNRLTSTICGSALVAHYSFFAQRPHLEKTDILELYRSIGRGKLSDSYYEQLSPIGRAGKVLDLQTINLTFPPQLSSYAAALMAELNGFEVIEGQKSIEIQKDGRVYKTLIGRPTDISDQDIDRALAAVYLSGAHKRLLPQK